MEQQNNLPTSTTNQSIVRSKPIEVLKTIATVNQIISFPLSDSQIEDWNKSILRMRPETTIEQLQLVIDKFLDGRTSWNHKEGLPNIFRGLNLLKIEKGEHYDEIKKMKFRNYAFGLPEHRRIYENEKEF